MSKEEIQKFIDEIKPTLLGCSIDIVSVENNKVKLKLLTQDIGQFKVKGVLVDTHKEIENNFRNQLMEKFPEAEIEFV